LGRRGVSRRDRDHLADAVSVRVDFSMNREWFSLAEVRAAKVPSLQPDFLDFLVTDFYALKADGKARLVGNGYNKKAARVEMQFHISLFLAGEQAYLTRTLCTGIFGRILKLGIHREVFDPRASYVPRNGNQAA
jgi:hypothetical protein